MKKLLTSAAVLTLFASSSLYASAEANFEFGDVFKDLKVAQDESQANFKYGDVFKELKAAQDEVQANFKFGDVFKDLKQ